ncbi:Hsp70 family protein [Nocardia farcinica]|uniref:Hsp70 family protein n=1 Tax=Nocardia farcinica TaxID=37329 RepID=UPI001895AE64|nr:Hsp70 family protein [Nocardia farcinica]MBF6251441.1 Hsp70 family protein [Nocardia farcinica]
MSSVLGVSVGASAVRLARPHAGNSAGHVAPHAFDLQSIPVAQHGAEELAAEAVGVSLATTPDIAATAIAYRSEQQARAVRAAMARQQLTNYELIPEVYAAVEFAQATGDIRGISSLVVYDLGSSGLTVSVVDTQTRQVRHSERTSDISGDYLDSLIREQQIASGRIAHPQDPAGLAALDALCREAKEQLSSNTAVALPSEQGLVLLAQENFESLIMLAIESSARMARDVIVRSDRPVHGVLAIGGCARIPLLGKVLERWMGVPVIVPESPETVIARGAALLARPVQSAPAPTRAVPSGAPAGQIGGFDEELSPAWLSAAPKRKAKRTKLDASMPDWLAPAAGTERKPELNGAVLTVSALVVVAAIGLGLGYGPQVLERESSSDGPTTVPTTTPARTTTLDPQIAVAPATTEVQESIAAPPPRPTTQEPPPPTPGPNTFVVPGLPPIVIPTIPPEAFPFPPPPR